MRTLLTAVAAGILLCIAAVSCTGTSASAETPAIDSALLADCARRYRAFFGDDPFDSPGRLRARADDYRRYRLLAACAELAYRPGESADIDERRRDTLLTERLLALGAEPLAAGSSDSLSRSIASLVEKACRRTPGFKARAFRTANGAYILSFAGTEPEAADIITDIDGAFSIIEPQNAAALRLTRDVSDALKRAGLGKKRLMLSGHSLGGRLASVGSIVYGIDAVAYNPANIPIDLHKQLADSAPLADNAERHLVRIHSRGDELTGGMGLGDKLRPFVPGAAAMLESGRRWLDDTTSMVAVKSAISAVPEIASAADAVLDIFGFGTPSKGNASPSAGTSATRITLALLKNMRRYNVNATDLQNPIFYTYTGRQVTPTPGSGGHSMAPLADQIDSIATFIEYLDKARLSAQF